MLKRYMHNRERHLAMLNDNRIVRDFDWGTEFVKKDANGDDPRKIFLEHTSNILKDSDAFFHLPKIVDYQLEGGDLSWASAIETPWAANNTVHGKFFPHAENKRAAVVILPHWNAKAGTYFDLCKVFRKVGISALRLTLPYHEERMPPHLERADYLVAPNIGKTLQSVRQAVLDTKAAIRFLKKQGYEKIGIVGTSIGSCIAFLALTHDPTIDAAVFNHVSGYMADVVWDGLSTYHVRQSLETAMTLDELREYWLPLSPMAYMDRLANLPPRPQRYIYTLYDLSFPVDLSKETMKALNDHGIEHSETVLPCGHYTLGEKPWAYMDGYKIVSYLWRNLK